MPSPYKVFEITEGAVQEKVEIFCRHLTENGSFTSQGTVVEVDVESLITDTYYEMCGWLAEFKYSTTQTDEVVLGILQYYNALGASAKAELSVNSAGFAPKENSRFSFMWKQYHDGFREMLAGGAFGNLGAAELTAEDIIGLTAGGISINDKKTIEQDTDATKYSFTRKGFDNPNSSLRTGDGSRTELP